MGGCLCIGRVTFVTRPFDLGVIGHNKGFSSNLVALIDELSESGKFILVHMVQTSPILLRFLRMAVHQCIVITDRSYFCFGIPLY